MNNQNSTEKKDNVMENPSTVAPMAMPLPPPPPQLERMPSIESEPKTLLHGELNVAREAAIEILNSHSREQALKIFLAGLQPVEIAKDATEDAVGFDFDDEE